MIQFNLLPDVKLEYVHVQRVKHVVVSAALIATTSAFVVFLLLFLTVHVFQRTYMKNLTDDITKYNRQLKSTADLDKILTIQNQLGQLSDLHAAKPAASRTFTFIQQITPIDVKLTDATIDYDAHTIALTGEAPSLDKVNTYADTIKYTKYKGETVSGDNAFSSVVLSQFTRTAINTTFTITASYEPAIFDITNNAVTLSVPAKVTTNSVTDQPGSLFTKPTTKAN